MIETIKIVLTEETIYRVRPNPDAPPGGQHGVVLEWSDDGGTNWKGHFFISPEAVDEVSQCLIEVHRQAPTIG